MLSYKKETEDIRTSINLQFSTILQKWSFYIPVLKWNNFHGVETIKSSVKKKTDRYSSLDFKSCFQQWPKCRAHCKELEDYYFEKFYVANTYSSYNILF
jgi:hypothetical protein